MDTGPIATDYRHGSGSGDGERIRLRATWPQRLMMLAPLSMIGIENLLDGFVWNSPANRVRLSSSWFQSASVLMALALFAAIWFLTWWFGVTLTPEAAHVHGLRARTIRWSQVAAVQTEGFGAGSRRVVLYEMDGRRTPLRAPITGFLAWDRTFDAKATVIHDWWLTHSGTAYDRSAATQAAPEPLPDRLRLRLPVTQAGPAALLLGSFAVWSLSVAFLPDSGTDGPAAPVRVLGALVGVALLLITGQLCLRTGATLTSDQLRADSIRRSTAVPWAEIEAITVEQHRGGRRIVVTDVHGQRIRLAAPRVGLLLWDRGFEPRLELLRRFWHTHRGADRAGTAAIGQARAEEPGPYQGPHLWQQLLVGVGCMVLGSGLAMFVLVGGLLLFLG